MREKMLKAVSYKILTSITYYFKYFKYACDL